MNNKLMIYDSMNRNNNGGLKLRKSILTMSGFMLSTLAAMNVSALDQASDAYDSSIEEIVVTGTLIRGTGTAPIGTNVIDMDAKKIAATGAISATEVLQSLPQNASFNTVQYATGASTNVTINRPSLRDIPGGNSGGSPTLVLFDGRRIVGMGVASTTADPDIIPPALIQRVETVPDGGSAIYGSDAVAGVINFITVKDFEGVQIESRYGTADSYDAFDGSVTAGKSWESGNAYISFNHSQNDALSGKDLDWFKMYPQSGSKLGLPAGQTLLATQCSPGNVRAGQNIYALPYGNSAGTPATAGTVNTCDLTDAIDLYPEVERNSIMIGLTQELGDRTTLDVRGYHMQRDITANAGPTYGTASAFLVDLPQFGIAYSPYYFDHFNGSFDIHNVDLRYGPDRIQEVNLETWGVYPTLTIKLPEDWQLSLKGSYGESTTENISPSGNGVIQNKAQVAGLFNPYNPTSSNPDAVAAIANFGAYGYTEQKFIDFSAIADGDLFTLPGGDVKLAVGVEFSKQHFDSTLGEIFIGSEKNGFNVDTVTINDPTYGSVELIPAKSKADQVATTNLTRDVKSIFSELVIPIVGDDNAMTGMQELSLSVSGRYDEYSDFGSTTNPKIGFTWRPLDWASIRGSWGKSFVAPSLANDETSQLSSATAVSAAALGFLLPPQELIDAGIYPDPATAGQTIIVVQGNAPDIQSQTATTKSIGFDLEPPVIENLKVSMTWWDIEFEGLIDIPGFTEQNSSWTTFSSFKTVKPSQAQIDDLLASVDIVGLGASTNAKDVYAITDVRINNTGNFNTDGLDLGVNYLFDTNFGTVDLDLNTSYILNREQSGSASSPFVDVLATDYSKLRANATLGSNIGNLRAQATLRYNQGYDLASPVGAVQQDKVDSFSVVDLYFRYDVQGSGMLEDLSLNLSINNVFDEDPPVYQTANTLVVSKNGYQNGGTIGRFIQVGFKKLFD